MTPHQRRHATYATLSTIVSSPNVGHGLGSTESTGQLVINFPAMPETLELRRQALYESIRTPATPDGFHWYRYTEPLKVPIKFSLSGFDEDYCGRDGPYALLDVAAKLHAMAMPIIKDKTASGGLAAAPTDANSEPDLLARAQTGHATVAQVNIGNDLSVGAQTGDEPNQDLAALERVYFPPACVLSIVMGDPGGGRRPLGITCTGFVESVSVTLHGPWLSDPVTAGQPGSRVRNMPSRADFEFTFVHQPGYTNDILARSGSSVQTLFTSTAAMVRNRLYNEFASAAPNGDQVTYVDLFGRGGSESFIQTE